MNSGTRLSILTPCFNSVDFIESCVEGLVQQNCDKVEHIIVDGGSTDGTVDKLKKLGDKYPHIRWISEKDNGQSDAMNKAIKMASAEYISFLNVDDYYSPGVLNEVLELIKKEDAPDFLVGNCDVWNENGEYVYTNRPRKMKVWHILSGHHLSVNPTAYFYKKNIHDKVGYYVVENHINMDIEFLIQAANAVEIKYYDKKWGNFRVLPDTKTYNDAKAGNMMDRKQRLFDKYLKSLGVYVRLRTKLYQLQRRKYF